MIKLILIVAVATLAIGCSARVEEIRGVDGFDPKEVVEMKELAPQFVKISNALREKLKKNPEIRENPEKVLNLAKKELESGGCFGACSMSSQFKQKALTKKKALELFVSLEDTIGNCATGSYEILAKNYIAHPQDASVTYRVLNHYRAKHAEHCRLVHKQKFDELLPKVPSADMEKLEKAFSTLDIYDFGYAYEDNVFRDEMNPFNLVGMHKPVFTNSLSQRALMKISRRLENEQMTTGLRYWLDENLFRPCKNFRESLATVLNEARFDAAAEVGKAQEEFLHADEKFYRALVANRMCASLLEEREKLYEPLSNAWHESVNKLPAMFL